MTVDEVIKKLEDLPSPYWLPIETAPKTGKWIEVWAIPKTDIYTGLCTDASWYNDAWRRISYTENEQPNHDLEECWTLTHWRPRAISPNIQGPDLKPIFIDLILLLNTPKLFQDPATQKVTDFLLKYIKKELCT